MHDDVGAHLRLFAGGDGVAVGARALPAVSLLLTVLLRHHRDPVRRHEGGVEAHAELTDDVHVFIVLAHLLPELVGAAGGDDAQIVLQLLLAHADAVVADGQGAPLRIGLDSDAEVLPLEAHVLIRQGPVAQLVDGVAGVGDDLPQEDLPVGVDGVNHQVQQAPGFRFEFLLGHSLFSSRKSGSGDPCFFMPTMKGNCEQSMTKL